MLVAFSGMVFGWVVSEIFLSWVMLEIEILLGVLVQQPEVPHFHRARTLSFYGVVDNADGCSIIHMYWGGRL